MISNLIVLLCFKRIIIDILWNRNGNSFCNNNKDQTRREENTICLFLAVYCNPPWRVIPSSPCPPPVRSHEEQDLPSSCSTSRLGSDEARVSPTLQHAFRRLRVNCRRSRSPHPHPHLCCLQLLLPVYHISPCPWAFCSQTHPLNCGDKADRSSRTINHVGLFSDSKCPCTKPLSGFRARYLDWSFFFFLCVCFSLLLADREIRQNKKTKKQTQLLSTPPWP